MPYGFMYPYIAMPYAHPPIAQHSRPDALRPTVDGSYLCKPLPRAVIMSRRRGDTFCITQNILAEQ
eukprot:7388863-Prymnesium_polylepis.1